MMTQSGTSKTLFVELLLAPIIFLQGSPKRANEILSSTFPGIILDLDDPSADGISTVIKSSAAGGEVFIIWVRRKENDIIAHEAVHTACAIMQSRGMVLDGAITSEEVLAYLVQNIIKQIKENNDG